MFTGAEMARCFMRGIRVLGVDPLGDYRRLVGRRSAGTYVELGAGGGLNPFALDGAWDRGCLRRQARARRSAGGAMAGGLSRDERPALDRALRAAYEAAGIRARPVDP